MKTIKITKTIIITLLLSASIIIDANAFKILTNINDLKKHEVIKQDGSIDYTLFDRLKSDGTVIMLSNSFSLDEKLEIIKIMGPGIVLTEDGAFTTINYQITSELAGYVDIWAPYNEFKWGHLFDIYTPYSVCDIYQTHGTVVNTEEIDWLLNDLNSKGFDDVQPFILVRDYKWHKAPVDEMLKDPRVKGVVIEMNPIADYIRGFNIDALIKKAQDMGKEVCVYFSQSKDPNFKHTFESRRFYNKLLDLIGAERIMHDDLYFVVSNYGEPKVEWFGEDNSVEATINMLKDEREHLNKKGHVLVGDVGCFINSLN